MSGRKRARGDEAGGAGPAAWEPALPTAAQGEAFLGALFGGGAPGLQALVRRERAALHSCRDASR